MDKRDAKFQPAGGHPWSTLRHWVKAKTSRYIGTIYKLKRKLLLKARLLSSNSLVQSHLNYCSLIWGTTNKSKIEQLFATQKKAIRVISENPTHTKEFFSEHEILTIHNIILKNILILMNKFYYLPSLLPEAVLNTIHRASPAPDSFEQDLYLSEWYQTYNTHTYRLSTFFKGPILSKNILYTDPDNDWITYTDMNRFK